jgi:hypothetical protein
LLELQERGSLPAKLEVIRGMSAEKIAFAISVGFIASGAIGLVLQQMLPEKHTTGAARDMVAAIVGLLTLLSALTLGLLIWTAYGVYAGQNAAIQSLAAKVLQLDLVLADYGRDAKPVRLQFRDALRKTIDQVWGADFSSADFAARNFEAALRNMRARQATLATLNPSTDEQRQALAIAKSTLDAIAQSRLQLSFALSAPVSYPLIFTVVSWVALGFLGNGLMSKGSPASVIAIIVGACAVASSFNMILDLSNPYSGAFRVSAAPLEQVLAVMGKE